MTSVDMHGASSEIQKVIEGSPLPPRLRERIYRSLADQNDVAPADAERIVELVQAEYDEHRVDPLEPVGTVSAQSIGEPGTQMSIPYDEQVLIREGDTTDVTEIGSLVDTLMDGADSKHIEDHEVAIPNRPIEVPSLGADESVQWKTVEEISRHEAPNELLEIVLESGRRVRATKSHSFVTREDNKVIPVSGDDLEPGDWLPVVTSLPSHASSEIDLRDYLSPDSYWFTSALTDGGSSVIPGGSDQIRNKRQALEAGTLRSEWVYPVQGTVGLPERFPLDPDTGFFLGAWLAEGSLTDYYVAISNIDPDFQERIRTFADRFELSVNEYENPSGFAQSYDLRVNGKVIADVIRASCTDQGEKIVPPFAYGANEAFVSALLRGYFSGDGNVGRNSIRASSTSDRLTAGIALLLTRFGIYSTLGEQDGSRTLRIPKKHVPLFANQIDLVGRRQNGLSDLVESVDPDAPDATDQIPNFGDALYTLAEELGLAKRQVNSATKRQRIGRSRLSRLLAELGDVSDEQPDDIELLWQAANSDVVWDRISSIEPVETEYEYVYDFSVAGLETFTTAEGVITHNTMNTFHYAGVAEIDVTQGLPRLIEIVDARKTPDTPTMKVYLDEEYATEREKAHEVIWNIEATRILALGDVSTNVADMRVQIALNEETLTQRQIDPPEIATIIEDRLGVEAVQDGTLIEFGPEQPSYRRLLQLVEELREVVFKGLEDISRVVVRKEESPSGEDEFVLYTEGSSYGDVLTIEGVDASRTTTNDIHEVYRQLGVEAAREAIINEMRDTLEEQGLDDVNIRHLMLVADIMTTRGTIESIGRHGIAGSKESVLARAAYEVTVNHLLDAAVHGEIDGLNGVIENVIVGKPIKLGTGDVDLRMSSTRPDGGTPN